MDALYKVEDINQEHYLDMADEVQDSEFEKNTCPIKFFPKDE